MARDQKVVGSNPGTVYWMDVRDDASYYMKRKLKTKVAKWGTPKKIFKNLNFYFKKRFHGLYSTITNTLTIKLCGKIKQRLMQFK